MKSFVFSAFLTFAVILSAILISGKVSSTMDKICTMTENLPDDCKANGLEEEINSLEKVWQKNRLLIALSVRRDLVYAMDTCFSNVRSYINTDQNSDYLAARGALLVTADGMRTLEKPGIESIF